MIPAFCQHAVNISVASYALRSYVCVVGTYYLSPLRTDTFFVFNIQSNMLSKYEIPQFIYDIFL